MDHSLKTFASVERPGLHYNNPASKTEQSENVYANEDVNQAEEAKRTGPALSDGKKTSFFIAAAVFLCLLCLLLLIGLALTQYTKGNSERDQLQTSYNNLTKEQDQLQTSNNDLTKERDQLQTSYNNLTKERDQLQKEFDDMAKEKNDLEKKLKGLGYVYFSGSFYYVSTLTKTWQQSRDDCQQRGADLVIINSKEEQDFLRSLQRRLWIGLTDNETEGIWRWVDGTLLTTSYWAPNEPNSLGIENCVEIQKFEQEKSWNDQSCNSALFWICEGTSAW